MRAVRILVLGLVGLAAGCGSGGSAPGPAAVRGKVTLNGEPVSGGLVVFAPSPERGGSGVPAHAQTGADGSFELRAGGARAIPPGWYRVALAPAPAGGTAFPAKLARPDLSGLEREVKPGQEHVFEFAVEVPKG